MFYPAYLVRCHREFSYRKVGDEMCDDFFFANFKWKYAGFENGLQTINTQSAPSRTQSFQQYLMHH